MIANQAQSLARQLSALSILLHSGARCQGGSGSGGGSGFAPWRQQQHRNEVRFRTGSSAAAAPSSLKAALRALFLRVHPDLFAAWPAERAENQRSFQLLQEYLQVARGGGGGDNGGARGGPASRVPYRFCFFLKAEGGGSAGAAVAEDEEDAEDADAGDGGDIGSSAAAALSRVELTLPPPEPPPPGATALSPAARKALAKLLALCGVAGFDADAAEPEDAAAAGARLLNFLPGAAEVRRGGGARGAPAMSCSTAACSSQTPWPKLSNASAQQIPPKTNQPNQPDDQAVRRAESGAPAADVRAANIRGAMRLARGVVAGFGGAAAALPGDKKVALLHALARVLDALSDEGIEVAGAHVMFGARTGLDARGTLWLDAAEADPEAWADFLGGVDLGYAARRREAAAALRALEAAAARAAGVAMVFAPAALAAAPEYRQFLERLAAHAADHGPVGAQASSGGNQQQQQQREQEGQQQREGQPPPPPLPFSELPIYVAPHHAPPGSGSGSGSSGGFELREGMGCVQVPVGAAAADVYAFALLRGAEALAALRARRDEERRLDDLAARARRALRLRRLTRDPAVAPRQFEAACATLLRHSGALLQHAEGLSVRVSDANRVDGANVDIAWDAEV